jgi:hypothetical protein
VVRRGGPLSTLLAVDLPLFLAATVSVLIFYAASQAGAGRGLKPLVHLPALMATGIGLSASNARAVLTGLARPGGTFLRTPKYALAAPGESWRAKRYRAARSRSVVLEGALTGYLGLCLALAVADGMWASLPFLWLFFQGYGFLFWLSVAPERGAWRAALRGWAGRRLAPWRARA